MKRRLLISAMIFAALVGFATTAQGGDWQYMYTATTV